MMNEAHIHRIVSSTTRPFTGQARGTVEENQRAHGNVTVVQRCACGAWREVNMNAGSEECGSWFDPQPRGP